jgi:hypothetical protein
MLKEVHAKDGSVRRVHMRGWRKQPVDVRDEAFRVKMPGILLAIPPSFSNLPGCSPVVDQGDLGSCTGNMFAGIVEFNELKRLGLRAAAPAVPTVQVSGVAVASDGSLSFATKVVPAAPAPTPAPAPSKVPVLCSRLFEYYATRKIEGTVQEDSGATIRDAIKAGAQYGVAAEAAYPYDITKFAVNPPAAIWAAAATHKVTSYHSIADGDLSTMKSMLASGFLVGFGFQVYDHFMSQTMATEAVLPYPDPSEQLQGGHAVCLVGYDDAKVIKRANGTFSTGAFLVRNSWGASWGLGGYFWMAYDYVGDTKQASDFWVVQSSPI